MAGEQEAPTDSARGSRTDLVVQLDDGRQAVLPQYYVESSTSLGYALTVFRSQGITVDHTFGLGGDSLFQEAGYTQLSRGRLSNNLYVTAPENPRWEIGHRGDGTDRRDALDSLVDALGRSREQTMAIDRLPETTVPAPDDLPAAYHEHAVLGAWLNDHAPPDVTDQLAAAMERDQWARRHDSKSGRSRPGSGQAGCSPARTATNGSTATRRRSADGPGLESVLRRYEYRLGRAAAYSSPEHVTDLLGPLPDRLAATERWQAAAGAIEAYRSRWNVTERRRSVQSPQTPSSGTTGAPLSPPWAQQVSWVTRDRQRTRRNGGAWRHTGRPCGRPTGRGTRRILTAPTAWTMTHLRVGTDDPWVRLWDVSHAGCRELPLGRGRRPLLSRYDG